MNCPFGSCVRSCWVKLAIHASAFPSLASIALKSCPKSAQRFPDGEAQTYLVVHVDAVEAELLHPRRHRVRRAHGVRPGGRRRVRGAERGDDEANPRVRVLRLDGRALVCG